MLQSFRIVGPSRGARVMTTLAVASVGLLASLPIPASAAQIFGTMNDGGGVYWRSAPDWNSPVAQSGNGFYPDSRVSVSCYQLGAGNVPGSSNRMWVQASIVSGSGHGSGWMNEHYVNDGAPINQAAPGIPACGSTPPPPPPPISNAAKAISWANSKMGQTGWDVNGGQCLRFVYEAYLYGAGVNITNGLAYGASHNTAYTYWTVAPGHHSDRNPPAGALVFWRSVSSPTGAGHVGLSEGGGTIISSYDGRTHGIHTFNINSYQQNLYLGWVQNW